jgi:hypothetical protein
MRKLLLFNLLWFLIHAQTRGDVAIEWLEKPEMYYGDFKINIPQFSGNEYHYDASKKSTFTLKIIIL